MPDQCKPIFRHKPDIVPLDDGKDGFEQTTRNVRAPPQQSVQEKHEANLSVGEGVIQLPLHLLVRPFVRRATSLPWNMETWLGLSLGALIHRLK